MKEEEEYKPSNRTKSKTAKRKKIFWCSKCDGNKVGVIGKCEVCGYIQNKKKIKQ